MPSLKYGTADVGGKTLEGFDADEGVAVAVEFRAPYGDGEIVGDVSGDAASHTALAGQSGTESEVARFIVESASKHQSAKSFGLTGSEDALTVNGVQAVVAQEQEGSREVHAIHGNGALVTINVQKGIDIVLDVTEAFHEVGERHVAVGIRPFGAGDFLVVVYVVIAAKAAHKFQYGIFRMGIEGHQAVSDNQCTCIDKGIARNALLVFQLHQGVERIARRLAPHVFPYLIAQVAGDHRHGEDLRDALYREAGVGIAHGKGLPVESVQRYAVLSGIHFRQRGNIVRHFSLPPQCLQLPIYVFNDCFVIHNHRIFSMYKILENLWNRQRKHQNIINFARNENIF